MRRTRPRSAGDDKLNEEPEPERTVSITGDATRYAASHQVLVLSTICEGNRTVIGGLILERGALTVPLDKTFAEAMAAGLADLLIKTSTSF